MALPSTSTGELASARGSGGRIDTIVALDVFEEFEIRGLCGPGGVLAAHPDECAREVRRAGRRGFVGQDAGIENVRHPLPFEAVEAEREAQAFVVDLDPQV